jgi:replicative DNA helicase
MGNKKKEVLPTDKVPPHSDELEKSLLASMLIDNSVISDILDYIPKDAEEIFYNEAHRKIFRAILELHEKKITADTLTVSDLLKSRNELEEVGGVSYIAGLLDVAPSVSSVESYASMLREKFLLRKFIETSYDLIGEAYSDPQDVQSFFDKVEQSIFSLTHQTYIPNYYTSKQVVEETIEGIERKLRGDAVPFGIPTGFIDLDNYIAGFHPAEFIIIAGRASMGKTSFCLNLILNIALKQGIPVGLFSLEMSRHEIMLRMLCSEAKVNSINVKKGIINQRDLTALLRAANALSQAPIYINDSSVITINEIKAISRRLRKDKNVGIIFIDFIQAITPVRRYDRKDRELGEISGALKALAKELNIPVVALSQLSRRPEEREEDHRPRLSDLRESGTLEQDADLVLFIYREEYYNPCECPEEEPCVCGRRGIAEIIIGKQRSGPRGMIKLLFEKKYTRFENLALSEDVEELDTDIPF